jgi:flagellar hook-associated protein 1 FlgK
MSIFSVGVSGLNAAQAGMLTAGHNIANASTPGYSRQEIVQGTNIPMLTGSGFQGQGTHVQTVKRIYDEFLGRQVLSAEASASEMDSYLSQIKQIDNLLGDPSAGLSPALSAFFKGVQEVAANPASIPSRQAMLSAAQSLVARFQSLDQRMSEIRDGVNSQISGQVTAINTYSSQLADINQRIILAQAGSQTQIPNDLLDQRQKMLTDLNKLIRVSTLAQSDGSFNVFIGNGQPLVVGTQSYQLRAVASQSDPERLVVAMNGVGGTTLTLPESQITGGTLGGLVAFRGTSLDSAQNSLGRIALSLAQNINDQHKLGMDLTGALGGDFFDISNAAPTVRENSGNSAGASVTGAPTVLFDVPNIDLLTVSDYRLDTDGTNFTLTRLADNTSTAITTVPQTVDGISIDTSTWTAPVAGDSFLIQPTRAGARNIAVAVTDARAIAAAAPIRTAAALANTGTAAINAGSVLAPPPADPNLQHRVTITFTSATTYDVFDATSATVLATAVTYPDPPPATGGAVLAYNGWTAQITGNPARGDVFTVEANANGVADNRNAMLLGALQTASTMLGGASGPTASYQSAYSQIVSEVGSKANEVEAIGTSQQSLVDHATTSLQQISGVNLDEEAANLLRYQQAYQASAKILEIAAKVFDEIVALGR